MVLGRYDDGVARVLLGAWGSFASCLRVAGRAKGDVYGRGPVVEGGGFRCVLGLEKGKERHGFL